MPNKFKILSEWDKLSMDKLRCIIKFLTHRLVLYIKVKELHFETQ